MKSIIQGDSEERCYICGRMEWIERHHIFNGTAKNSLTKKPNKKGHLHLTKHTKRVTIKYNP